MEHHSLDTGLGKESPLFAAIMNRDEEKIKALTARGETFSDELRAVLVSGCRSLLANKPESEFMLNFIVDLGSMTAEEFLFVIPRLRERAGAPLHLTNSMMSGVFEYKGFGELLFGAEVLECFFDCFEIKKINKKKFMSGFVEEDRADLLALCAGRGWLGSVKTCDELIELANNARGTECAAFLLDHKNTRFDLAAERVKAEKRAERRLSAPAKAPVRKPAAPDSSAAMRELWRFGQNAEGTITVSGYRGGGAEIEIPEKIGDIAVTRLKVNMMLGGTVKELFAPDAVRRTVARITMPDTVALIEDHVFDGFCALTEVNISEKAAKLGAFSFFGCSSLKKLRLPKAVREIGESAFENCAELAEINIPDGVTEIARRTFTGCGKLRRLTLPPSVRKIGSIAFWKCASLSEINIPIGVEELPDSVFAECGKLSSVDIPVTIRIIGDHAFNGCKSLTEIIIPSGVTAIGKYSFSSCESLQRVVIPETVTKIGEWAFAGCKALKTLVIPEGVTDIGGRAFADCPALRRVELPRSLARAKNFSSKTTPTLTLFDNTPNITAAVYPKSYAEGYCKRNNIPFVYMEG